MTIAVYLAMYAGLIVFLAGCLWRVRAYARTPFHLRWELYPVPHEEPRHAEHGGSYFESSAWWLSPQAIHHRGEWMAMFREIVFLRGLWEYNRPLWLPSFLFHFGLYLSIAAIGLGAAAMAPGAVMGGAPSASLAAALVLACRGTGAAGILLVLVGALLLLYRRMADPALKNYTKAGDIFNLVFFIATFAFLGVAVLGPSASMEEILRGAFHFDLGVRIGAIPFIGIVLASALAAYIPFTHMSHFIAKYFTWHSVRWDDRRNAREGALEKKIAVSLGYRPTWAAPHVGANGEKNWAEVAATNPAEEVRK